MGRLEEGYGCPFARVDFGVEISYLVSKILSSGGRDAQDDCRLSVFDADNHMYEMPDAFTKYLPKEYEGLIKYVQVNGRNKIAVNNEITDYIPNPTFEVVAAPGAQEEYFKREPRG